MISVTIESQGLDELISRVERYPTALDEKLYSTVIWATEAVYRQARDNIGKMFRNPGKMQSALQMTFARLGDGSITGAVSISGIGYVTQEFGGRTAYDIFPKSREVLAFPGSLAAPFRQRYGTRQGRSISTVFAAHVHREPLPERSFLRLAMNQKRAEINAAFHAVGASAWSRVV